MKGYFGNKKVKMVYLGDSVIYRDEPLPKVRVMEIKQVHVDAFTNKNAKLYLNGVLAQVGDIFYKGDVFEGRADDGWTISRVLHYVEDCASTAVWETQVSPSILRSTLPQGYCETRSWSNTYGFSITTAVI